MDKIAIVIPVHNRRDVTILCLKQLQGISRKGFETEIIVVDDGSTDGTAEAVERDYPDVAVLKGDGNLWWSGGVNKGFRYVLERDFDFIYLINDDSEFDPPILQILYDTLKNNENAVCASILMGRSNRIYGSGVKLVGPFKKERSLVTGDYLPSYEGKLLEADTLPTKSVLLPVPVVRDVGLFDYDRLPHNYADFDYFVEVKKKGYTLLVNMSSIVYTGRSDSNYHDLILSKSVKDIFKTFTDIKYGNHIRSLYNYATKRAKPLIGQMAFLYRLFPYVFWLFLRIVLPKKTLLKVLVKTGRIQK
jgi:GT2 family glycosyltransferase